MSESEKRLRCLAVDDEPHALKILKLYIEKVPFLELIHATTSPWQALEFLQKENVDILFLDIQMDDLTGLQLLDLVGKTCPVILTTAYSEYALEGYEYQVEDYLLKPFSFERFLKAVTKIQQKSLQVKPNLVAPETNAPPIQKSIDHIFVKGDSKNKFHRILLQDIFYIEGLKNYVQFICKDGKVVTLQNLKKLEEVLPGKRFLRIHKSYIINVDQISEIDGHALTIHNKIIPIGSSYRTAFFKMIREGSLDKKSDAPNNEN